MNANYVVASVMTWNAMTNVPIPQPIPAILTSTSHNMCLHKRPAPNITISQ